MHVKNPDNATFTKELNTTRNTGLYIILTTDEDASRPVYISGNFNNWRTQDKEFMMEKIGNSLYHYKFPHDFDYPVELLYKFTKGDWSDVEIDKNEEGVLLCRMKNGTEFRCKMKGTHNERIYEEQLKLIGKHVTFTYQTLTVDGVPQFPVGIAVRELDENWEPQE